MNVEIINIPKSLLPDPAKLEVLAEWFDRKSGVDPNKEIQNDLRRWACYLREFGVDGQYKRKKKKK